jgi:hypothetical protein
MAEQKENQLLTMVQNVVAQHGCRIADVDFDTHTIHLEGPEDAKGNCARAIAEVLG